MNNNEENSKEICKAEDDSGEYIDQGELAYNVSTASQGELVLNSKPNGIPTTSDDFVVST